MKSITITGTKRENVGKKATKALRDAELVPCVVYGEQDPIAFSTDEKTLGKLVYTPEAHTVELIVEGQTVQAVLQDIQYHPLTDKILHVDFYQLRDDKPVVMEVPVRVEGRSRGVVAGGVLRQPYRKVRVKALPGNLPDEVVIDITPLRIGMKVYVGDVKTKDFTLMHPDNTVIVAVRTARTAIKGADADDDEEETEGAEGETSTEEGAAAAEETSAE